MSFINDGTTTDQRARVSGNRLFVQAITEGEARHATEAGDAYNLNTGTIGLTSSNASSIMYIKNNEDRDLIIEAVAVGIGSAGTTTDVSTITLIRNPTSVSYSTAVDQNQNRNFGSSKTLTADVYKGAEAATTTGGNNIAQFFQTSGGRLFANIGFIIPKGDSLAIEVDTNTSSGTTNVYAAIVCHLKENNFKELS
jgi:hypothetical protein